MPPNQVALKSVIVNFPAGDLAAGPLTKANPGMAIRLQAADEILHDGLDVEVSVLNASLDAIEQYRTELESIFEATIRVLQNRPSIWRASVIFHNVEPLLAHPVYGSLVRLRKIADRSVIVFEAGLAIQRIDVEQDRAELVAEKMRAALEAAHMVGTVRIMDADRALEDWQPLQ